MGLAKGGHPSKEQKQKSKDLRNSKTPSKPHVVVEHKGVKQDTDATSKSKSNAADGEEKETPGPILQALMSEYGMSLTDAQTVFRNKKVR